MRTRSFAGLDSQKPSQMAIVSLTSPLNDPVRRYHGSKCSPQGDVLLARLAAIPTCPCQLVGNVSHRSPFSSLQ